MREIAHHILDIVRNSLEAGATRVQLAVSEDDRADRLVIEITDNGRGMTPEVLERVIDPFYTSRSTRRQGLGLPLLKATCDRCGGVLALRSTPGHGTVVRAEMQLGHLDRPPVGDMGAVIQALACEAEHLHLTYRHDIGPRHFGLDTNELQYELDDIFLRSPVVLDWLRRHVNESLGELRVAERAG